MYLSDADIQLAIKEKQITVVPAPELGKTIAGCSVDLRIGNCFRRFKQATSKPVFVYVNANDDNLKSQVDEIFEEEVFIDDMEHFTLKPGEVILAHTHEHIEIDDQHVGIIEGKSTLARLGVEVHLTSNRINPGWKGQIVLEIANNGPTTIKIQPKSFFSAISFVRLTSKSQHPYGSTPNKYQGQKGAHTPQ